MNNNVQALRAGAAYAVVCHHIIDSLRHYVAIGRFPYNPHAGRGGVDLFFAISGFVMMLSVAGRPVTPFAFLRDRLTRIAPVYWLVTGAVALAVVGGVGLLGLHGIGASVLLKSLLFVPVFGADGAIGSPVLFVGWSLDYEMMFYLLFAISLAAGPRRSQVGLVLFLLIALWIAHFVVANPYVRYLGDDIILTFGFGVMVWGITRHSQPSPWLIRLLVPLGIAGMASVDFAPWTGLEHSRVLIGASAAILLYAAVAAERIGMSIGEGLVSRQGDASYSLYLLHPLAIQFVGKASIMSGLNRSATGLVATVIAMLVVSGLCGTAFHRWVEKPLTRWVRDRTRRARPVLGAVAASGETVG
jgi:exopolysaccharide production protein ExoZ